jgi:3-oxoacyl-[acyl-carrier-protein] synthase-3
LRKIKSKAKIVGISACLPKHCYKNINYPYQSKKNLIRFINLTGISERRIVNNPGICASDLAEKAINKLVGDLKWNKSDIDFLIFVTQTSDYLTPSTSIILQHKLKLKKEVFAYDINLGCSGVPYGISTAFSLIDNLNLKKGILVLGDVSSKLCNIKDKSSWLLFGDACSAIAIEKQKKTQISYFDYYSDGEGYKDIIVPSHSLAGRNPISVKDFKNLKTNGNIKKKINMTLNGANIFSFSTIKIPENIKNLLKFSSINDEKIKFCFLHQANKLINENIRNKLNIKKTIFPTSLKKFGNTSSASIPVTIVKNFGGKKLSGTCLLSGFGVGLSASNLIYEFKECSISKFIFY